MDSQTPRRSGRLASRQTTPVPTAAGSATAVPAPASRRASRAGSNPPRSRRGSRARSTTPGQAEDALIGLGPTLMKSTTSYGSPANMLYEGLADDRATSFAESFGASRSQQAQALHVPTTIQEETANESTLDSSKSFGDQREAGVLERIVDSDTSTDFSAQTEDVVQLEPSIVRRAQRCCALSLRDIMVVVFTLLVAVASFCYACIAISRSAEKAHTKLSEGHSISHTQQASMLFMDAISNVFCGSKTSPTSYVLNNENISNQLVRLDREVSDHRSALEHLKAMLPPTILMIVNPDTNEFEVSGPFWEALRQKLRSENMGKSDESWDSWFRANQRRLEEVVNSHMDGKVASLIHDGGVHYGIVDRDSFISDLKKNKQEFEASIQRMEHRLERKYETITAKFAKNWQDGLALSHLETLATANVVLNIENSLKRVNYFAPGNGAQINTYYTSPVVGRRYRSIGQKLYLWALRSPYTHDPIAALHPWQEPSDCFCAAATEEKGKAQLGVKIPAPIRPTQIVIEHLPKAAAIDVSKAPKWLELHIAVRDPNKRKALSAVARDAIQRTAWSPEGEICSDIPNHVCLGRFMYNPDLPNHVQTFSILDSVWMDQDVASKDFVIRVTENWGNEAATCLYRVRMSGHGIPSSEQEA